MATLVSHWDFHEGSGTALEDIVGTNEGSLRYSPDNGNTDALLGDGSNTNGPLWVPGRGDGKFALRFADAKDNFVATTNLLTNPTNFSLSLWFKGSLACGQKLFGFENSRMRISYTYDRILYVGAGDTLNGQTGRLHYGHWSNGAKLTSSAASVVNQVWHHVAVLLTSGGQYSLYLDGIHQGTLTYAPEAYNGYWRIGGSNFTSYGGCWTYADCAGGFGAFDGDITDVRMYSGILTIDEIYTLSRPPDVPSGSPALFAGGLAML